MQHYKVTAVSYLNTKPFIYGLENSEVAQQMELSQDFPAICAEKLLKGEADIALVPVAVIPQLDTPHIVSDYCIGAVGAVKTVCLFSEVPIEEITNIYLDYQSRTSVALLRVLCKEYWKVKPCMVKAYPGYTSEIRGTVAGVVIGDRAIAFLDKYPYVYDLAAIWQQFTGLPFVFAAWVSPYSIDEEFLKSFNEALKMGLEHREQIGERHAFFNNNMFDSVEYLSHTISYPLDTEKRKGMQLFLEKLASLDEMDLPELHFDAVELV
jgi:chorismate dehydratase